VLLEFPVSTVEFYIPKWAETLENEHKVKQAFIQYAVHWLEHISRMRDLYHKDTTSIELENEKKDIYTGTMEHMNLFSVPECTQMEEIICKPLLQKIHTENGTVELRMEVDDSYYFEYLSDIAGMSITSEYQMISMIKDLSAKRAEYEKVEDAIQSVCGRGYGVVAPKLSDITMEEPILINHAGKYGVKIRANSPSIHMIKANIETEIAPIVGNKEQAEDLISYIKEGELSADGVWSANIFGKSLGELMEDGIRDKIMKMDDECQLQLQNTMQKIVNDNNGGMVCIII
ncbi:MAG: stage IV sporulation protein A, partial [Lachnospiraceae bacterium]|nr:stage IV sporulation protein A [Lachnospiraceae bacterium]